MGLSYTYLSKEDADMAGQGTTAEVRVYRTVDGELVGEGDPRGAFLAYAPGHAVPAGEADAYNALVGREHGQSKADRANAGDDEARQELREQMTGETRRAVNEPPALMHDRLATELADEQRVIANSSPEVRAEAVKDADPDAVVTTHPVYRTETGDLVHEGHPDAFTLAYAPGQTVADGDLEQFADLGEPPAPADDNADDTTKSADAAAPAEKRTRSRRA